MERYLIHGITTERDGREIHSVDIREHDNTDAAKKAARDLQRLATSSSGRHEVRLYELGPTIEL
jgi:hypothetical protein